MPAKDILIGSLLFLLSLALPLMCGYPLNASNMFFIVGMCRSGGDTIYAAINDGKKISTISCAFMHAPAST